MTVIALTSVKGAPGVTTTAVALGAVWPQGPRVLVAECDAAGGDVASRFDLPTDRGLVSLAAEARRSRDRELLWRHTLALPGGLEVVAAPVGAEQAHAALRVVCGHRDLLVDVAADPRVVMLADCGRLDGGSPAEAVLRHAQVVLVCVEPRLDRLASLAARLAALRQATRALQVVLVGSRGYGPGEVADALGVEVAGALPDDTRAAALVGGRGGGWAVNRLPLLRAARTLAGRLAAAPAVAPPPRQPGRQAPARLADRTRPRPAGHDTASPGEWMVGRPMPPTGVRPS